MEKNLYNQIIDNAGLSADFYNRINSQLTYTFKENDGKRINKDGNLVLYDIDRPLEIPVTQLLGKWKKDFVGITVGIKGGKWFVEKGTGITKMRKANQHPTAKLKIAIVKRRLLKFRPFGIIQKLLDRRMNEQDLLTNV